MSSDHIILYPIICEPTNNINFIEKELYKEYPELKDIKYYFICKGKALDK